MPESCCAVGCSQRRVKGCGIPFYRISEGKHSLKLEGDKIGLKLLADTNGVKSRSPVLESVAIFLYQVSVNTKLLFEKDDINNFLVLKPWKIFLLDILQFQWLTLLMIF